MSSSYFVKRIQTARLNEWLGDFEEAEKIYMEIKADPEIKELAIGYIIKGVVVDSMNELESRKLLNVTKSINNTPWNEDFKRKCEYKKHKTYINKKWKYTITVMSKLHDEIRVDIKGFNLDDDTPNLFSDIPDLIEGWEVSSGLQPKDHDDIDFLEINGMIHHPYIDLYLTIDRWGLLRGVGVCKQKELGDVATHIHIFLCEIERFLWERQ